MTTIEDRQFRSEPVLPLPDISSLTWQELYELAKQLQDDIDARLNWWTQESRWDDMATQYYNEVRAMSMMREKLNAALIDRFPAPLPLPKKEVKRLIMRIEK